MPFLSFFIINHKVIHVMYLYHKKPFLEAFLEAFLKKNANKAEQKQK